MSTGLQIYTLIHVAISLVAIGSGFVVLYGMLSGKRLDRWTAFFLATTVLTSVTGFGFPITGFTPGIIIGIISLVVLAPTIYARYPGRLAGPWRPIYVITAVAALYLNFFVLIVQSFMKVPALHSPGAEPIRATLCDCSDRRAGRLHGARLPRLDQVSRTTGRHGVIAIRAQARGSITSRLRETRPRSGRIGPSAGPRRRVVCGDVVLLGGVVLQVEEAHRAGRVAGAEAGVLGRLGLLVGCEDRHAVGPARVDPAAGRGLSARVVGRRQDVQLPAGVAHRRQAWPLLAEDDVVNGVGPCPRAAAAGPCRRSRGPVGRDSRRGQGGGEQVHHHGGRRQTVPAGSRPGQRAMQGTRKPPSQVVPFMPRRPPVLPPNHGPLSLVKIDQRPARPVPVP